jgi:hypothetical protein
MSSEELLLNENNKNGSDNPKKEELAKLANTSVWWVNHKVGKNGGFTGSGDKHDKVKWTPCQPTSKLT